MRCDGFGFGDVTRAFLLAEGSEDGSTARDFLDWKAAGEGWGHIIHESDMRSSISRLSVASARPTKRPLWTPRALAVATGTPVAGEAMIDEQLDLSVLEDEQPRPDTKLTSFLRIGYEKRKFRIKG